MSSFKGIFGSLLKVAAQTGETAIHQNVRGTRPNLAGCTPCAANAKAVQIAERNDKFMGMGKAPPKRKKSPPKAH